MKYGSPSSVYTHELRITPPPPHPLYIHGLWVISLYIHDLWIASLYIHGLRITSLDIHGLRITSLYIHGLRIIPWTMNLSTWNTDHPPPVYTYEIRITLMYTLGPRIISMYTNGLRINSLHTMDYGSPSCRPLSMITFMYIKQRGLTLTRKDITPWKSNINRGSKGTSANLNSMTIMISVTSEKC